jgi:Fe2+ or Zn2+ uptake regulation protein
MQKKAPKNEEWSNACKERTLRASRARGLILLLLEQIQKPLSVPEMEQLFLQWSYKPNKTTLYREVEYLVKGGYVNTVQVAETRVSYELAGHHHHHFICQGCFDISEIFVEESLLQKVEKTLEEKGHQVWKHSLEFFGMCKKCYK